MARSQARATKKPTGARYKKRRKKKLHELGSSPTLTKLGKRKLKKLRVRSANNKMRLLTENIANVLDKKTNTYKKVAIKAIVENNYFNPSNNSLVVKTWTLSCPLKTSIVAPNTALQCQCTS